MKTLKHIKYYLLITIIFSLITGITSCRKKAKTDEEMREMIVGVWCVKKINASPPKSDTYQVIEFNDDGRYRFMETFKGCGEINYLDTLMSYEDVENFDDSSIGSYIIWTDSIFYEINNGQIIFSRLGNLIDRGTGQLGFNKEALNIEKLTNRSLIIDDTYEKYRYKKK